jgi:hypothetical protein
VHHSARFDLHIDTVGFSGSTFSAVGSGTIDGARKLSSYDFVANGKHFTAVIGASPQLTVFLAGETVQNLPNRSTWAREDGGTAAPMVDPGLALRLDTRRGRTLGSTQLDGVRTTKLALTVGLPDAALLAPMRSKSALRRGVPVLVWVDGAGNVRRLHAVVSAGSTRTIVDERLSGFGTPARVTRPSSRTVWDHRLEDAERLIRSALLSIEPYNADNSSGGKDDPKPRATGYTGMTVALLRRYDPKLRNVKIVRANDWTFCVQATVNGITAKKDGPSATIMAGGC